MVLELSILVGEVVARIFGRAVTTLEVVTSDKKSFTMCSVVALHRFFLARNFSTMSTGVLRISSLFFSFRLYGALQQSFYSGIVAIRSHSMVCPLSANGTVSFHET